MIWYFLLFIVSVFICMVGVGLSFAIPPLGGIIVLISFAMMGFCLGDK